MLKSLSAHVSGVLHRVAACCSVQRMEVHAIVVWGGYGQ